MSMGLYQKLMREPVSALELRELITVQPSTTVREAILRMQQNRLGCVAVVDSDGRPVGKFTERLLIRLLLTDSAALGEPVSQHMNAPWSTVTRDDSIARLIDCMESGRLRYVCVVDGDGRAEALVGQKGVTKFLADQFPREVKVQLMTSKQHMDQREGA